MATKRYTLDGAPDSPVGLEKLRLLYASSAQYSRDWHSVPHAHTCTELFFVLGGMGYLNVGELSMPVAAGDLILINPNVEHTEHSSEHSPLEYAVLGVSGLEFEPGPDGDGRYCLLHFQDGSEPILHNFREILREMAEKQPGCRVICQNLLEGIVIRVARRAELSFSPGAGRRPNKECAQVRRYIDSNFKENITLDQLAQLTHINKYYMVHIFSREYGVSPISYLISRRITESKYLLENTDHSLSQISHMLGFSSPSYFSQSFRRLVGMPPLEYRKSVRGAEKPSSPPSSHPTPGNEKI